MIVADYLANAFVELGVRHVFGVGGANIEDVFVAVQRRRPQIRAVLAKHEHGAGTAADAYARISGGLGVVLATSGGGAMNLTHSLAEARASCVPLLAVVGDPPTSLQGRGAFQDTSAKGGLVDARAVYQAVAKFCARVEDVNDVPRLFAEAVRAATARPAGPAVLIVAKDRQSAALPAGLRQEFSARLGEPEPEPEAEAVRQAAARLEAGPVVVLAGDGVARTRAQAELAELVERLDARVAVTPDGRDAFDNSHVRFLGVCGSMGHPRVPPAIAEAATLLVVGTRLPIVARQGLDALFAERNVVSIGHEPPFVQPRALQHLEGSPRIWLAALARAVRARERVAGPPPPPPPSAPKLAPDAELDLESALLTVERALPERSVVVVDAGNVGAAAVHVVRPARDARWLLALGMAGMGYSFGAAIGAALASGRRCFVLAGDGAFFMHGMEVHTAVEHALPITFVVFDNSAHGMCLVRERLLLETDAEYNGFRRSRLGAGLGAMLPSLVASECRTVGELERALAAGCVGPAFVSVVLPTVEVPPFAAFQDAGGPAFTPVAGRRP